MTGYLCSSTRGNRGLWAAVGALAVLQVFTLSLFVLAFQGRFSLPAVEEAVSRHGRSLLVSFGGGGSTKPSRTAISSVPGFNLQHDGKVTTRGPLGTSRGPLAHATCTAPPGAGDGRSP